MTDHIKAQRGMHRQTIFAMPEPKMFPSEAIYAMPEPKPSETSEKEEDVTKKEDVTQKEDVPEEGDISEERVK